ncbi:MAG: bifunctional oligoribonuclease/PAP phosphatase NrnA [Tissierellia bacterium]|nr:bifunctional oligoribonuclease/PAP phosphatase NrnA [Tissierellia bacterium]
MKKMMNKIFNNIIIEINNADSIGLISHKNPDGDNLGSMIALYKSLQLMGKKAMFFTDDNYPDNLKFMPYLDEQSTIYPESLDLLFCLDSSEVKRLKDDGKAIKIAKKIIVIDHHKSNEMFGDINYIVDDASSTGELVFNLLEKSQMPINKEIAECIYIAIATDTGNFRYSSTHASTFRVAAKLLDMGIDLDKIRNNLYESMKLSELKLITVALNRMRFFYDNKVCITYVTKADYANYNAKYTEADNIVQFLRDLETVEIGVILKETDSGYNLSIRTKTFADASLIAKTLGGGGHIRAAGANINSHDVEFVIDKVLKSIDKETKDAWNFTDR